VFSPSRANVRHGFLHLPARHAGRRPARIRASEGPEIRGETVELSSANNKSSRRCAKWAIGAGVVDCRTQNLPGKKEAGARFASKVMTSVAVGRP